MKHFRLVADWLQVRTEVIQVEYQPSRDENRHMVSGTNLVAMADWYNSLSYKTRNGERPFHNTQIEMAASKTEITRRFFTFRSVQRVYTTLTGDRANISDARETKCSKHSTLQQSRRRCLCFCQLLLRTNSTRHSSSWEVRKPSASQEMPCMLRNLTVLHHIHKRRPLVPLLGTHKVRM